MYFILTVSTSANLAKSQVMGRLTHWENNQPVSIRKGPLSWARSGLDGVKPGGFLVRHTQVHFRASPRFPCHGEKYLLSELETASAPSGVSVWTLTMAEVFYDRAQKLRCGINRC